MSRNDFDAFGDIINEQAGIFGKEQASLEPGLKKHDAVNSKATAGGVVLQLTCQGCGRPTHMTIEWPEVIAVKYGVDPVVAFRAHPRLLNEPTAWEFLPHEQSWRPQRFRCRQCNFHIPVRLDPSEPERMLAAGRRLGFVDTHGEAVVSQIASAAAQVLAANQHRR